MQSKILLFLQLRFSVKPQANDVMLDDVSFDHCREGDFPAGADQLSCDFENDTCSWYDDYSASLLWKRSTDAFSKGEYPTGRKQEFWLHHHFVISTMHILV